MAGDRSELEELRRLDALEAKAAGQAPAAGNPVRAGLGKLGTNIVGLPVDAIESAINIPPQAAKLGLMAAGRYDIANQIPMLQGSFGGSQYWQNVLKKSGLLNTDNPNPSDKVGTAAYDFAARGGAIPGGALPAVASIVAEKIGGPDYAAVGSMAPTAAISGYNAARAPALAREQAQNAIRDKTLKEAQDLGLKTIPSQVNPGPLTSTMETIAGKAAVKQQLTKDNAAEITAIARRDIGMPGPAEAPIDLKDLHKYRDSLMTPYSDLAGVSSNAQYFLREYRDANQKATQYWKEYEVQKTVASLEKSKAFQAKAAAMEQRLQAEAIKAGKPDLVPQMKEAKQAIAKTWDVERALNLGDGSVDAKALARAYDHGAPLSGGLETIAKFAGPGGPGRQVTGEAAATPSPGVNNLKFYASPAMGAMGYGAGGPAVGAAMAAAPFVVPPTARSIVTSGPYQDRFAQPNYSPAMQPENSLQAIYRAALLESEANKQR